MKVIDYITEEVYRQGHDIEAEDGRIRISWMLEAWDWAIQTRQIHKIPGLPDIEFMGKLVEQEANKNGFRDCGVRVGSRVCCSPEEVPYRLSRIWNHIEFVLPLKELELVDPCDSHKISPIEFYKKFEVIHPFRDGNGRVGKILLNWLNNSLNDPIFPPNDLWGYEILNP